MNMDELIRLCAEESDISEKRAGVVLNCMCAVIQRSLERGEDVKIQGFGSWKVKQRAARVGRNVWTGEPMDIPAHRVCVFKPSTQLANAIKSADKVTE